MGSRSSTHFSTPVDGSYEEDECAMTAGSADLDFGVGEEGVRRDRHVLRRRPFAHATGAVVLRAVAGTEPAVVLALGIADCLPFRDAAEMGADADHHEPRRASLTGAVLVGGRRVVGKVGVARERVWKIVELHGLRFLDLFLGAMPNEDRLPAPHYGDRLALGHWSESDFGRGNRHGRGVRI